jgi:predicted glycosyltransferase
MNELGKDDSDRMMTAPQPRDIWPGSRRRVMLYSHDTFGLGHLRRCRTIAHALAASDPEMSVLILTGSPVAGRFDFASHVDHVRLPGVVKLPNGEYASHNLGIHIEETVRLRTALIASADAAFQPDMIIVDKEAAGFRGELLPTLEAAKRRGAALVLGLRDVLDDPDALAVEWARKGAMRTIEHFFDEVWVYGLPQICEPLIGLGAPQKVLNRVNYTGYLRRETPDHSPEIGLTPPHEPYVLVTTGGGGDGAALIDWVISAYEHDAEIPLHAVILYGPFMAAEKRAEFERRAEALTGRVTTASFDSRVERLLSEAVGAVAMGGYNTFCEILSMDKPAVVAPRVAPRREQLIRAEAAERLGLARMLHRPRDGEAPEVMARAIRGLATQKPPSAMGVAGLLSGLDTIVGRAAARFHSRAKR